MSSSDRSNAPSDAFRIGFLAFVGILTSLYLLYHHVSVNYGYQTEPSFCNLGGSFNCDAVAGSNYSELFGIPIASFGFLFYLVLVTICLLRRPEASNPPEARRRFADTTFALSVLSLPPTLFLAFVSLFVIKAVCIFCSLQYLINLFLVVRTGISKERTPGIMRSFIAGIGGFLRYLSVFSVAGVLLWLVLLSGAAAVYVAPQMLLEKVFKPRDADTVIDMAFDFWKDAPQLEIEVDDSEDPNVRDYTLGPDDAPVTVVEFSDFQCPHCQRASVHLKSLIQEYPNKVRLVFKNFPLDGSCNDAMQQGGPHDLACQAALFARCAGAQGEEKFWKMHDALFALEASEWSLETLDLLPDEVGLDAGQFNSCVGDAAVIERIKQDIALGSRIEIPGTPALFINGKAARVARFEHLKKLVGRVLVEERRSR